MNIKCKKVSLIGVVLDKVRKLIRIYRRSNNFKLAFKKISSDAKLKENNLFLNFKVRWNSLYLMIERFIKYKQVVNTITLNPSVIPNLSTKQKRKIENLMIFGNDWELIEVLIVVLKPFYDATLRLQKTSYTMFGLCKIIEKALLKWCQKQSSTTKNKNIRVLTQVLHENLNKHFVDKISASQKRESLVINQFFLY